MKQPRPKKGDKVRVTSDYPSAGYKVLAAGSPPRWEHEDVPAGTVGTVIRSSPDSGPCFKFVRIPNGHEVEIHYESLEIVN